MTVYLHTLLAFGTRNHALCAQSEHQYCYPHTVLSELYQENLVTEDEVKRTVGEGGFQANQLFHIQLTKTPEVIMKTADVLDKFGYDDLARRLRG